MEECENPGVDRTDIFAIGEMLREHETRLLRSLLKSLNSFVDQFCSVNRKFDAIKLQVDAFEKQKELLQQRISVIEALQRNRSGGQELLDAVANTVSRTETVWLTSLARKGNSLTLNGTAGSINAVAEYITQLRRSGYFSTVEIKETHQNDNPDVQLFEFTVTADFAPPAANQTATPPTAPTPAPTAAPKRVG